ncbi:MAG: hypothetical protein OHK0022_03270 [Roseiflexaceae bacterium]
MSKPLNPFARSNQQPVQPAPPNPYLALYGLSRNPFPTGTAIQPHSDDPRTNGKLYARSLRAQEEQQFIRRFFRPPPGEEARLGLLGYGGRPYSRGQGKSAFLYALMRMVHEERLHEGENALAVFLQPQLRPTKKFWQILRLCWKSLAMPAQADQRSQLQEVDIFLRARALTPLLPAERLKAVAAMEPADANALLLDNQRIADELHISIQALNAEILRILAEAGNGILSSRFADVLREANYTIAQTWRIMERWSDLRWSRDGAEVFLDGLAAAIVAAGFNRLFVFFDEYEKIFLYQNNQDRAEFLDGLRNSVFDSDTIASRYSLLRIIIFIHPLVLRDVAGVWRRVGLDRFLPLDGPHTDMNQILLSDLTEEQLYQLLTTYLDAFRADTNDPRRGSIAPFSNDAFATLVQESLGIPGYLLAYAHFTLAKALRSEQAEVSQRIVQDVVAERPRDTLEEGGILSLPASDVEL